MNPTPENTHADAVNPAAGEHLKRDGMAEAAENTDPAWAEHCDEAIEEMARRGLPFQAADMVAAGLVGEPDKHQRWGPRFRIAHRAKVIEPLAAAQSKRKHTRRSLLQTWVGTHKETD